MDFESHLSFFVLCQINTFKCFIFLDIYRHAIWAAFWTRFRKATLLSLQANKLWMPVQWRCWRKAIANILFTSSGNCWHGNALFLYTLLSLFVPIRYWNMVGNLLVRFRTCYDYLVRFRSCYDYLVRYITCNDYWIPWHTKQKPCNRHQNEDKSRSRLFEVEASIQQTQIQFATLDLRFPNQI